MFIIQEEKKVQNILYPKRTQLYSSESYEKIKDVDKVLLKNFPKYIHDLEIGECDGRTITRLKRTKMIHKLYAKRSEKKARAFLANKTKSVQKADGTRNPEEMIQKVRLYPFLRTVSLYESAILSQSQQLPEILRKGYRNFCLLAEHIKGMSRLESMKISIETIEFFRVLQILDSSKRLKDLKSLEISIREMKSPDQKQLSSFSKIKNFLNAVTYFNMHLFDLDSIEAFKNFSERSPNLKQLALEFGIKYGRSSQIVLNSLLRVLPSFQKLEKIEVQVNDPNIFIVGFTLPTSIKHVQLKFSNCNDYIVPEDFNEDLMFNRFFERWSQLKNLESLEIKQEDLFEGKGLDFCYEILKRVPQLRELRMQFEEIGTSPCLTQRGEIQVFDLKSFFGSLKHIAKDLEVLDIEADAVLSFKDDGEEALFPKLSKLNLHGQLIDEINLENYVELFETCFKKEKSGCKVELSQFKQISMEVFIKLLEHLKKYINKLGNLEIIFSVGIGVEGEGEHPILETLVRVLKELEDYPKKMKNIQLFVTDISDSEVLEETLEPFGKLFKHFKI